MVIVDFNGLAIGSIMGQLQRGEELSANLVKDNYKDEMICLCKTRGDTNYMEAKIQFDEDVLLNEKNYNGIIAVKIGVGSVKNLAEDYVQSNKNML